MWGNGPSFCLGAMDESACETADTESLLLVLFASGLVFCVSFSMLFVSHVSAVYRHLFSVCGPPQPPLSNRNVYLMNTLKHSTHQTHAQQQQHIPLAADTDRGTQRQRQTQSEGQTDRTVEITRYVSDSGNNNNNNTSINSKAEAGS